jgi:DNA-binding XRE family transcriptional regulator
MTEDERNSIMTRLRQVGLSDEKIAKTFNLNSRQHVHQLLGPKTGERLAPPELLTWGADRIAENFKTYIKQWRELHRLSQAKMAQCLGVDQTSVACWENGLRSPAGAPHFYASKLWDYNQLIIALDYA